MGPVKAAGSAAGAAARRYVDVGGRLVHVRVAGEGPPVLLLHDAPGSSREFAGILDHLASRTRAYALDAPGHGLSDPLSDVPSARSYVDATLGAADALGLRRFAVAGWGAGGMLAAALSSAAPDRVTVVVSGDVPAAPIGDRQARLDTAFPTFDPRPDGSHLIAAWHAVRSTYLFDPWWASQRQARRQGDVPAPAVLHDQVLDILRPGERYADLARAFAVPGIPRWDGVGRRVDQIVAAVTASGLPAAPAIPEQPATSPDRIVRSYVDTPYGQLHLRSRGTGGVPLVVVHSSPGFAAALEPLVDAFAVDRTVLAFDTLGNGDSDRPPPGETEISFYADVLGAALDALGVDAVDVWGSHTGALIGLELAIRHPHRVRKLGTEGVPLFGPAETEDLLTNYLPPLQPDDHGTHLLQAWNMRADMALFWPWYRRTARTAKRAGLPDPRRLHALTMELLVTGETWRTAYRAAFAYPTRERLPLLPVPALVATSPADTLAPFTPLAARLNGHVQTAESAGTAPPDQHATAQVYRQFFGRI